MLLEVQGGFNKNSIVYVWRAISLAPAPGILAMFKKYGRRLYCLAVSVDITYNFRFDSDSDVSGSNQAKSSVVRGIRCVTACPTLQYTSKL